jgi:hypothetical protein
MGQVMVFVKFLPLVFSGKLNPIQINVSVVLPPMLDGCARSSAIAAVNLCRLHGKESSTSLRSCRN